MFIVFIRTAILYTLVVIVMRIMGKRQIGELQPYELVITIIISELASIPISDTKIPLVHSICPIITLILLQVILSVIQMKFDKARTLLCGKPSLLVKNGSIDINEMKKQKLNLDDLLEELRLGGYYNLEDIEYAILETSGKLSVIPKTKLTPVTKKDLNIKVQQDILPLTLISDGKVRYNNLESINKDITWLKNELARKSIYSCKDVFIGIINSEGKTYFQKKDNGGK